MSVIGQEAGIEHGTVKGYKQHAYRKIESCDACKKALRDDRAAARRGERPERAKLQRTSRRKTAEAVEEQTVATPVLLPVPPPPQLPDRPEIGVPIEGRELEIGDVIVFLGNHHRIDRFESYTGSLRAALGEGTRVACSGGWGMTVGPRSTVRILPRPAGGAA
ncbi:hypothetical protein AB0395_26395 [Streptosporangium sp. NPDC051023]|uniref:hypothetical protein n=1 Tax=Streptosporangium sp. NPDC051023 TaxID=3155410 RepID=UPI00344E4ED8